MDKSIFNKVFPNAWLIGCYSYQDLQGMKHLFLSNNLSERELDNLEFLPPRLKIEVPCRLKDEVFIIAKKLKELGKKNKVYIDCCSSKEKSEFNEYLASKNGEFLDNVFFSEFRNKPIALKNYVEIQSMFREMIGPAKFLSPFEKYIYAYNVVKNFKEYKDCEDASASRDLYEIVNNEYMVCLGFTKLFGELLSMLDIPSFDFAAIIDDSYDDYFEEKEDLMVEKPTNFVWHSRRYVHLIDEKYGIDGFYVSDPTWDNDLENDFYSFLAMTNKEEAEIFRMITCNQAWIYELFDINKPEDFYDKLEFLLSRKSNEDKDIRHFISSLMYEISVLDSKKDFELREAFPFLLDDRSNWPDDCGSYTMLLSDLSTYVASKVNNEISGETIMSAVREVYANTTDLTDEELDLKMEEIISSNCSRHYSYFPKTFKINSCGVSVIMNEYNKFELAAGDLKDTGRSLIKDK